MVSFTHLLERSGLSFFSGASRKKKIFPSFLSIRVPLVWWRSASLKESVLPLLQDPGPIKDFLVSCVLVLVPPRGLECLVRQRL